MTTVPFLEYLQEHGSTQALARELAGVLALRGRGGVIPARMATPSSRRIAS